MITKEQLKSILYRATDADIEKYLPWFNIYFPLCGINEPGRVAAFIAQIGHESGHLKYTEENLNYSAEGLRQVFGKYFPTDEAARSAARQPEKIANIVYANRNGNGDPATGDGWRFRGRGLLQITGRENYARMGKRIGADFITCPERLSEPEYAVQTACSWWQMKGLNGGVVTDEDFKSITRTINGGTNGLSDRIELWKRAKNVLS